MTTRFRVLVVCTGNICRSPMGERQIRAALDAALPEQAHRFDVSSAGTYAGHRGEPMQPGARQVLRERGIDADGFAATPLVPEAVGHADLVLTAERGHRTVAVRLAPEAADRVFTLREFGRLLEHATDEGLAMHVQALLAQEQDPVARAFGLVRIAADRRRERAVDHDAPADDIDDPYAQPVAAFRTTADVIDASITGWIPALAAAP